ncbi:MAG: transketolase [Eubacteriales bacterium]|nr:transketolase [Eubacteriales bacterium]
MDIKELKKLSLDVRRDIINMTADAASGHPGGSLSATDILVALHGCVMNIDPKNPKMEGRDRFVLSKGHAAPALYGVLGELGFFDKAEFKNFRQIHSFLQGHPDCRKCPGVEASTGSLGQGISIAVGMALGAKAKGTGEQIYTMVGDGEIQEGLVWEASMAASKFKLDNFTVILDNNGLQIDGSNDEVMPLGDLNAKFTAFGYDVIELEDGNDIEAVIEALKAPHKEGVPKCIIAHTVKGKGVSYMENQVGWHGKAPNQAEREIALAELDKAMEEL